MDKLQLAAKDIFKTARKMISDGEMPLILGTQGLIAVTWDRYKRYLKKGSDLEIREAAALALIIYFASEKSGLDSLDKLWDQEDQESEESQGSQVEEEPRLVITCPRCQKEDQPAEIAQEEALAYPVCDDCLHDLGSQEAYEDWVQKNASASGDAGIEQ